METITLQAIITNTSKKQSGKFTSANPRKSVYLDIVESDKKKALDFGMREYSSKEGESFFITKASGEVKVYNYDGKITDVLSGGIEEESQNFSSDGAVVHISLMKSENAGNEFIRMYAVLGELIENAPENPFAHITNEVSF